LSRLRDHHWFLTRLLRIEAVYYRTLCLGLLNTVRKETECTYKDRTNKIMIYGVIHTHCVDLGGLVVSVLATGPKVHGFDPDF
jgi:hypothetical protein